jgi:ABC-type bacteriocin/lantibiotic exporter with double-glycine peptidase domain
MKIELKNVVFKYPTRDVPVLNGLNMTVSYTYGMTHRD